MNASQNNGNSGGHAPFWKPWGVWGFLWRTLVFLAGILLICYLLSILKNNVKDDGPVVPPPPPGWDTIPYPKNPYDTSYYFHPDPYDGRRVNPLPPDVRDGEPVEGWGDSIPGVPELPNPHDNRIPPINPYDVAYYTKDLPQTDSARNVLLEQTANCLLNAGYIYYDGINNIPKALECYLRLTKDFTSNSEIAQAFYMLYKIYDKQGNTPNANYYKDMVLMGFPDSDFSNLILDEDYYKEIIHRSMVIREDYEAVYNLYRKHRYGDVVKEVAVAKELYEGNPMLGKFKYWEGLSYVRMDNKQQAVATFQGIVNDYPASDTVVTLAQQQLDYLMGEGGQYVANSGADEPIFEEFDPAMAAEKRKQKEMSAKTAVEDKELSQEATLFRYKENIAHFVIILMNDKKIRATVMQSKVGDFNMVYYANSGFTVKPLLFNDSTQMVTISRFNTAAEAMDYYRHLLREEGPLADYDEADYKVFAISQQNYTTFYKRKKIDAYKEFFDKYYLIK